MATKMSTEKTDQEADSVQPIEQAKPDRTPVLDRLVRFCHFNLNYDKEVRDYLTEKRRLTNQTIVKFQLGAFPSLAKLARHFTEYELLFIGAAKRDEDTGNLVSKFNTNRLIMPIYDVHGRPVAISGRVLCNEEDRIKLGAPKYDNTVYSKTSCLYGLNLAKSTIRAKGAALVVEGQFDVISAVQAGTENVVGSSGAFFSMRQQALLARYCHRIYLGLDQDEAGIEGTRRVMKRPPVDGVLIREKKVPAGFKDWDEYFYSKM